MAGDEQQRRVGEQPVRLAPERLGRRRECQRQMRHDHQIEDKARYPERGGRRQRPAGERHDQRQRKQRALYQRRSLPFEAAEFRGRHGRSGRDAPAEPQRRQRQDEEAERLVPLDEFELQRQAVHALHGEAEQDLAEEQRRDRPVEAYGNQSVGRAARHACRLAFVPSPSANDASRRVLPPSAPFHQPPLCDDLRNSCEGPVEICYTAAKSSGAALPLSDHAQ